jgi:hypothetical protein
VPSAGALPVIFKDEALDADEDPLAWVAPAVE